MHPFWNRRTVQWCLLALVVLVLLWVLGQRVRQVQGLAERAAVVTMLGAVRTALVIAYVQQGHSAKQPNPFLLFATPPAGYNGEGRLGQTEALVPGRWVFDPVCGCIGYRLLEPEWLEQPANTESLWFRMVAVPTGPAQAIPLERYVWQGDVVQ